MQLLKLFGVGGWQQVATHREHLSEFEKHQPQFLQGFPYFPRRRPVFPAKQGAEELVTSEHAENLQQSRQRAQFASVRGADQ